MYLERGKRYHNLKCRNIGISKPDPGLLESARTLCSQWNLVLERSVDVLMSGNVLPYELSVWIPLCSCRVAAWDVFWLFGMCFWVLRCFKEIFQQCFLAQMGCTVVKSTQILGIPSQELNINGYLKKLTILGTYHIQGTFFLFKCQFKILGSCSIF